MPQPEALNLQTLALWGSVSFELQSRVLSFKTPGSKIQDSRLQEKFPRDLESWNPEF